MPRPAKIWKRSQDGFYYTKINGKQEKLSPNFREAKTLFHALKTKADKEERDGKRRRPAGMLATTLFQVIEAFLQYCERETSPRTYANRQLYLQSFCDHIGKSRRVRDISKDEFLNWARRPGWGESTRAAARKAVTACFNWGVKNDFLFDSPLWGLPNPKFKRRERVLRPWELEKIRPHLTNAIGDFVLFLLSTGGRPFSEAAQVTADMIDWREGSITLERHKNASKGKSRVIYLPPFLLDRLRQLAQERPEGPLLLTNKRNPWTRPAACKAMRRLEEKAGIARLTIYAFRHTYITSSLMKGLSPTVIGRLVGNSARTISRFYEHCDQMKDELRDAARRAAE